MNGFLTPNGFCLGLFLWPKDVFQQGDGARFRRFDFLRRALEGAQERRIKGRLEVICALALLSSGRLEALL